MTAVSVLLARDFLEAVDDEIASARVKFPGQEETLLLEEWLSILVEEVGEVARAINEQLLGNLSPADFREQIGKELVQVAAMAGRSWYVNRERS